LQRRVPDRECEYDRVLRQERRGQDVRCSVHQKFDAETVSMRWRSATAKLSAAEDSSASSFSVSLAFKLQDYVHLALPLKRR